MPVVLVIVIAVIVVLVMLRVRRGKWPRWGSGLGYREHFDETVIVRQDDGTVTASNQLYDMNLQPASPDGLISLHESDRMRLGANGSVAYSKGLANGDGTGAFTNPLYNVNGISEHELPDDTTPASTGDD